MILYHHVDTDKLPGWIINIKPETEILKVAEIMDIWHTVIWEKSDYHMIERYIGMEI